MFGCLLQRQATLTGADFLAYFRSGAGLAMNVHQSYSYRSSNCAALAEHGTVYQTYRAYDHLGLDS